MVDACKSLLEHRGIGSFQFCEEAVNGEASKQAIKLKLLIGSELKRMTREQKNLKIYRLKGNGSLIQYLENMEQAPNCFIRKQHFCQN